MTRAINKFKTSASRLKCISVAFPTFTVVLQTHNSSSPVKTAIHPASVKAKFRKAMNTMKTALFSVAKEIDDVIKGLHDLPSQISQPWRCRQVIGSITALCRCRRISTVWDKMVRNTNGTLSVRHRSPKKVSSGKMSGACQDHECSPAWMPPSALSERNRSTTSREPAEMKLSIT